MFKPLLEKFKKSRIPNSYFAVMALAVVSVVGVVYLANIMSNRQEVEATADSTSKPEISVLSRNIDDSIVIGMRREEVIRRLGKPSWAAIQGDKGTLAPPPGSDIALELRWANPSCRDAVVMFTAEPYLVTGWDDGSKYCGSQIDDDRDDFSCNLPDRQKLCR